MYLYSHIWKSFIRNERWKRNLFTKILYLIMGFYFIILFVSIGFGFTSTIAENGRDAAGMFHEWIIWYLLGDYLIRCLIQPFPALEVIPYLRLRIRRRKLAVSLIVRTLFGLFNILPLFLILPFVVRVTGPIEGTLAAILFSAGCILLIILNNMLALVTGMLIRINPVNWLIPAGMAGLMALLFSIGVPFNDLSRTLGLALTGGRLIAFIIPFGLTALSVHVIYRLLHQFLRVDRKYAHTSFKPSGRAFSGRFSRLGDTGRYMSLETAMLTRNKRSRNTMMMVPFFLIYAIAYFLFYDEQTGRFTDMLFTTMFIGLGAMSYGQLIFSWESTYFDGVMARKHNFLNYLKAKYYLQALITLALYIPVAALVMVSGRMSIFLVTALMLFLAGPNTCLAMVLATFNDGKVDLDAGTFMNYQGVRGSQFVMTLLFVIIPMAIFRLSALVAGETGGTIVIASIGMIFIVTHEWWLKQFVYGSFMKRRYRLLEGYRKLDA